MLNIRIPALVALGAITLAACGGGVQGTYVFGEEGAPVITLELRSGDVAVITLPGLGDTEGTYSVDGDAVTVVMEGDPNTFTMQDGNLVTQGFGESMVFEKQ